MYYFSLSFTFIPFPSSSKPALSNCLACNSLHILEDGSYQALTTWKIYTLNQSCDSEHVHHPKLLHDDLQSPLWPLAASSTSLSNCWSALRCQTSQHAPHWGTGLTALSLSILVVSDVIVASVSCSVGFVEYTSTHHTWLLELAMSIQAVSSTAFR